MTSSVINQSIEFIKSGKTEQAIALLGSVLIDDPDNMEALSWSGTAKHLGGRSAEAVGDFLKILELDEENCAAMINLGAAYIALGQAAEAELTFKKAHKLDPTNADVNYNLGFFAEMNGKYKEAIIHYQETINYAPHIKEAYIQLGNVMNITGQKKGAFLIFCEAEERFPNDTDLKFCRGKVAESLVPGWHLPMLADQERNDAFQAAIEKVVKPGDVVLDVGTGSGLLAMMAVRAGAAHVYACEMVDAMAMTAQEVIELNGFGEQITIIDKNSSQLKLGKDLPEKVDVIVSETFDFALVGEGALTSLRHAKENFLKEGGKLIPESGELYGVVLECPFFHNIYPVQKVNGFDLSPMNVFSNLLAYKDARITLNREGEYKVLTDPFTVAAFDFYNIPPNLIHNQTPVRCIEDGIGDSIHMWFDLHLCEGVDLSTKIRNPQHHWRQPTQALLDRIQLKKGQSFRMQTTYGAYFNFVPVA